MRAKRLLPCGGGLLVAIAAAVASLACAPPCGPDRGVVAEAADGDTITLESGEKIRYLLVDTPESTQGKTECYGVEARDFNRQLVLGQAVTLRYDPKSCTDRFGRTLAYVSVEGREVNRLLIERGFGCVLFIPPGGEDRRAELEQLEAEAKAERRGLWGACSPNPCGS